MIMSRQHIQYLQHYTYAVWIFISKQQNLEEMGVKKQLRNLNTYMFIRWL